MERVRLLAPLVLLLLARRSEAQQSHPAPMKIAVVEMDTVRIPRTHVIAALVRTRLEHYTTREELRVVPRKVVTDLCDSDCPERWDGRWLREVAKLLRVDVVVDLTTSLVGTVTGARGIAYYPSSSAADTVLVRGTSDDAVADTLAMQLNELLYRLRERRADSAAGAARVVNVPEWSFPLDLTRQWAQQSPLGDLRRRAMEEGDVEVRAWGGYGLRGTKGVVVRRERGTWRAWRVEHVPCKVIVDMPVHDTASATTLAGFLALARRKCGSTVGDVRGISMLLDADTLAIEPLSAGSAAIERAWNAAEREGMLSLPAEVSGRVPAPDGFTYVIEVRRGSNYRASVIEQGDRPGVPAD
ncbi:MAG TPA: hypothetical protein VFI52_05825, partial [Gemmatimonadaceae bacterium]|nr:hypothetical protein [Gemmatimonadaceae bacterium]